MDRNYYSCVLVDFNFRSFPKQTGRQQHYSFGGKVEVTFRGYSLNDDELKKLNEELERSDFEEVFENVKGATEESLDKIYEEINYYINEEDEEKKEENKEKKSDQSNPFVALFGGYNSSESKKASKKKEENRKENWYEKEYLRPKAQEGAKETAFSLFDKYKKAHGMNSFT